jgi:uncharacterized protein with NRDE domain
MWLPMKIPQCNFDPPITHFRSEQHPEAFLNAIHARADQFGGFNLILGDSEEIWYYSNRHPESTGPIKLTTGVRVQILRPSSCDCPLFI